MTLSADMDSENRQPGGPVVRQAHNLKVIGSNPIPATKIW
jgi:hypothetical protein